MDPVYAVVRHRVGGESVGQVHRSQPNARRVEHRPDLGRSRVAWRTQILDAEPVRWKVASPDVAQVVDEQPVEERLVGWYPRKFPQRGKREKCVGTVSIPREKLVALCPVPPAVGSRDLVAHRAPANHLLKTSAKGMDPELRRPPEPRNQLSAPEFHIGIDGGPGEEHGHLFSSQRTCKHLAAYFPGDGIANHKGLVGLREHPARQPLLTRRRGRAIDTPRNDELSAVGGYRPDCPGGAGARTVDPSDELAVAAEEAELSSNAHDNHVCRAAVQVPDPAKFAGALSTAAEAVDELSIGIEDRHDRGALVAYREASAWQDCHGSYRSEEHVRPVVPHRTVIANGHVRFRDDRPPWLCAPKWLLTGYYADACAVPDRCGAWT